jgi:hypothetical protein
VCEAGLVTLGPGAGPSSLSGRTPPVQVAGGQRGEDLGSDRISEGFEAVSEFAAIVGVEG